MSEKRAIVM